MKIPKYIEEILERRARLACQLTHLESILDNWLETKGFDITECPLYEGIGTSAVIYVEPFSANDIVRRAIESGPTIKSEDEDEESED